MGKIFFLGPPGTFSFTAAQAASAHCDEGLILTSLKTLRAVAAATAQGNSLGVMAYHNRLEGLIQESLDLLVEYNLGVVGYERVQVSFSAGSLIGGIERDSPVTIVSHPKALAQCDDWWMSVYPDAEIVEATSTAVIAPELIKTGAIFIAKKDVLEKAGLRIIADEIANGRGKNFTEFFVVAPSEVAQRFSAPWRGKIGKAVTILTIAPNINKAGLLFKLLKPFKRQGINIAKIHSRPGGAADDRLRFYLEVESAADDVRLKHCLKRIERFFAEKQNGEVAVLGSYVSENE